MTRRSPWRIPASNAAGARGWVRGGEFGCESAGLVDHADGGPQLCDVLKAVDTEGMENLFLRGAAVRKPTTCQVDEEIALTVATFVLRMGCLDTVTSPAIVPVRPWLLSNGGAGLGRGGSVVCHGFISAYWRKE